MDRAEDLASVPSCAVPRLASNARTLTVSSAESTASVRSNPVTAGGQPERLQTVGERGPTPGSP